MDKDRAYENILESEEKIEGYVPESAEKIEGMDIEVRDHLEKSKEDECGYCGQVFGPDEVVIEREIHGRKWRFCSEECYRDFLDASNFKDEDLDSKDVAEPAEGDEPADDEF